MWIASLYLVGQKIEVTVVQCLDERPPRLWSSLSLQPLFEDLCHNHLWVVATDTLDVVNLTASVVIEKKCSELSVVNSNFRRDAQLMPYIVTSDQVVYVTIC